MTLDRRTLAPPVRVRLARIAELVIAHNTAVAPSAGIVVAESGDGVVDLELRLRLFSPAAPAEPLARILRADLRREAAREGLSRYLGAIDIQVGDLLEPVLGEGASRAASRPAPAGPASGHLEARKELT